MRHLLSINDLTPESAREFLTTAAELERVSEGQMKNCRPFAVEP